MVLKSLLLAFLWFRKSPSLPSLYFLYSQIKKSFCIGVSLTLAKHLPKISSLTKDKNDCEQIHASCWTVSRLRAQLLAAQAERQNTERERETIVQRAKQLQAKTQERRTQGAFSRRVRQRLMENTAPIARFKKLQH